MNKETAAQSIKAEEWQKDWEGKFSLLNTISCEPYYQDCFEILGTRTDHVLIFHQKGITSCLLNKKDNERFAGDLAKKLEERPELAEDWATETKREYDRLLGFAKLPDEELASAGVFREFVACVRRYSVYMIAMKSVVNVISESVRAVSGDPIVDARRQTEKFYFEVEKVLERAARYIGAKEGYESHLVEVALASEVQAYLEGGRLPAREVLASRYEKSAFLYTDSVVEFDTTEARALEQAVYETHGNSLRGIGVYPGKGQGPARVITDYANQKGSFTAGEVLVTGMTDPNYLPLMRKASAIVVDTGGLLSHAAITARELRVPCIIGTEKATKLFKDGDLVEVDADAGIVRKL